MKKYIYLFAIGFTIGYHGFAQNAPLDSNLINIHRESNDSNKVKLYNKLHQSLLGYKDSESILYSKQGLYIAKQMKWEKGEAVMLANIAESFANLGFYDSSFKYYYKAIDINERISSYDNLISNYINLSSSAKNCKSDYLLATQFCFKALALSEKHNAPMHRSTIYNNLATLYLDQSNVNKSISYASKGLDESQLKGDSIGVAASCRILSKGLLLSNDLSKSSDYLKRALSIYQSNEMRLEKADCIASLALLIKNDFDSIIKLRLEAQALFELGNLTHPNAITNMGNLGIAYHDAVRYQDSSTKLLNSSQKSTYLKLSKEYLSKTIKLCHEIGNTSDASYFTGCLAELQATQGDFRNAYLNFRIFQSYQDSIYSQEYKNQLAEIEGKHTIDIKNAEIKNKEIALKNRNYLLLSLGATALSLLGILFALTKQSRDRKVHNETLSILNRQLEESNQIKLKFLSILSHDLRSPIARLVSFLNLQKELPEAINATDQKMIEDHIRTSATTLLSNMESLLLWSKSNSEQFKIVPERILLYPLLKEISKGLPNSILVNIDCSEQITVYTDRNILWVILSNLTSNVIKAIEKVHNPVITYTAVQVKTKTILTIADNGPGFSNSFLSSNLNDINSSYHGYGWFIINDMAQIIQADLKCYNENGAVVEIAI
ncbi:MAG: GHKL domain-containing protein [Chitinophagaceae bacterium]|nr:GHKL domain-containing protein [Chitinophagaceae bacterium]